MNARTAPVVAVWIVALLLASPTDAWAYIDPNTGSYLIQMLVAGGMAGAYMSRRYWLTVRSWFTRDKQ